MDYPEPQGVWDLPGEGGGESGGGGSGGGCYGQEEEEEEEEEESRGVEHPLVRPPRRHHLHHQHHQQHQQHHQQQQLRAALSTSSSEGEPEAAPPRQLSLSDSAGGGEFDSAESGASLRYSTGTGGEGSEGAGLASSESGGSGFAPAASALPERKRPRSAAAGGGGGGRPRYEVVRELGAEEVRWFYREDRKTWKPFIGYDSLRIELAFRALGPEPREEGEAVEPVCVRSGLYEVDVVNAECYPVYWNRPSFCMTWDFFLLQGDATGISDAPVLISSLASRGVLALPPQLQKEVVMYAFCHPSSRGTVPCIHLPPLLEERGPRGTGEGAGTSALLPISSEGIVSRGLAGQACIWSPGTDEQWHHLPSVPVSQLDLLSFQAKGSVRE